MSPHRPGKVLPRAKEVVARKSLVSACVHRNELVHIHLVKTEFSVREHEASVRRVVAALSDEPDENTSAQRRNAMSRSNCKM